jgi:hypothetical protein
MQWICADPVGVPHITSWILSFLDQDIRYNQSVRLSANRVPLPDRAGPQLSTFEKLPSEILSHINLSLQAPSTLRLRRCSKTLASRIVLDQTFWRENLTSGNLIDYLWDLDTERCRQYNLARSAENGPFCNWRKLAQRLMSMGIVEFSIDLHNFVFHNRSDRPSTSQFAEADSLMSKAPLGLKSRCRIVKIIRDIERLDKIETEDPAVVEDGELVNPHKLSPTSG